MSTQELEFCINCGAKLESGHRFCWNCGAPRWSPLPEATPAPPSPEERPPPTPGTSVFTARPAPAAPPAVVSLGLLPWFYAAGAVFCMVEATQLLAILLAPGGHTYLVTQLTQQGIAPSMQPSVIAVYWITLVGLTVAAALHGAAFHGLRRHRRWGWIAAVVVAALWSLVLVGIPVLARLLNRDVRRAFGVE